MVGLLCAQYRNEVSKCIYLEDGTHEQAAVWGAAVEHWNHVISSDLARAEREDGMDLA